MRIVSENLISKLGFASFPTEILEVSYYSCKKIPDMQLNISSKWRSPRYETSSSRLQLSVAVHYCSAMPRTARHHYMKHNRSFLYHYGKNHTEWTPRTNTRTQPQCPCYRLSGSKTLDPLPLARQGMFAFPQSHALLHMMTTNASSIFPLLTIFNAFQIVLSLYFSSNFPVPALPYWKNYSTSRKSHACIIYSFILKIRVLVKWVEGVIFYLRIQTASCRKETTFYRRSHKSSPLEPAVSQNSPSFCPLSL